MPSHLSVRPDVDPSGIRLWRLVTLLDAPAYVKEASSEEVYAPEAGLPDEAYADPARRRFPCHTKAACWVSAGFLAETRESLPVRERRDAEVGLRRLAVLHGIDAEVEALLSSAKSADARASDSTDDDYAVVLSLPDGRVLRRYPIRTTEEVKAAADYLDRHQGAIPSDGRRDMAHRILKHAVALGVAGEMPDSLDRHAGFASGSAAGAARALARRADLARLEGDAELEGVIKDAVAACRQEPAATRENLAGLVLRLEDLDRERGWCRFYGNGLERPDESLMAVTAKSAQDYLDGHCALATGSLYKVADLAKLDLEAIRDTFGDEFAQDISAAGLVVAPEKLASQAHALPRPDAELLERLLMESGVRPAAKQASATGMNLTDEVLRELAVD